MSDAFNNPTCNYCMEKKKHLSYDCSGDVYYRCGDCLDNPVMCPVCNPIIGCSDDYGDDD